MTVAWKFIIWMNRSYILLINVNIKYQH
jgi:hypothetical protein